jgi:hypothetical protein
MKRYTRRMIRSNPDVLFVFGDNLARRGRRGQAKEARGEPNAVGIATKVAPSHETTAYLADCWLDRWRMAELRNLARLERHIRDGGFVVWPLDGIGTGLAKLAEKAPAIEQEIAEFLAEMEKLSECYPGPMAEV